jgi:hypothetical protein
MPSNAPPRHSRKYQWSTTPPQMPPIPSGTKK